MEQVAFHQSILATFTQINMETFLELKNFLTNITYTLIESILFF